MPQLPVISELSFSASERQDRTKVSVQLRSSDGDNTDVACSIEMNVLQSELEGLDLAEIQTLILKKLAASIVERFDPNEPSR